MPLFTMNVYDRIIPNKAASSLWVLALGAVFAIAVEYSLRLARTGLIDEVGRGIDARLSQRLLDKVLNLPLATQRGSTGALARRVTEYEQVRDFFASTTIVLVTDILFLFVFQLVQGKLPLHLNDPATPMKRAFLAHTLMRKDGAEHTRERMAMAQEEVVAGGYSEDQQFFLSYAQIWCTQIADSYQRYLLKVDEHAPARYRVQGPLANLPSFAEAFSCKDQSAMSPQGRCAVW